MTQPIWLNRNNLPKRKRIPIMKRLWMRRWLENNPSTSPLSLLVACATIMMLTLTGCPSKQTVIVPGSQEIFLVLNYPNDQAPKGTALYRQNPETKAYSPLSLEEMRKLGKEGWYVISPELALEIGLLLKRNDPKEIEKKVREVEHANGH
jgi:hypothetical protein